MSQSSDDDLNLKGEIQKVLMQINEEMDKLKTELLSLNTLVQDNASLPMSAKMMNEKLLAAAKDAGIDFENIGHIEDSDDDDDDDEEEEQEEGEEEREEGGSESPILSDSELAKFLPSHSEESSDNEAVSESSNSQNANKEGETSGIANVSALSDATKKLTKNIKRALR